MDKIDIARREGMSYALRIAEEKGIDGLKEDLKRRGALNLPVGLSQKKINKYAEEVKLDMLDSLIILAVATLRDEFGFGAKRGNQFIERFNEKAECIADDYCSWKDYIDVIKDELGIDVDIKRG